MKLLLANWLPPFEPQATKQKSSKFQEDVSGELLFETSFSEVTIQACTAGDDRWCQQVQLEISQLSKQLRLHLWS